MEQKYEVKDVAIYLRKSRGEVTDDKDDLNKTRTRID